jgi:hypothetical protein
MRKRQVFERYGNTRHLRIERVEDLKAVLILDEALWIATSAPVQSINMDADFLSILDHDGDGRIKCRDLRRVITYILAILNNYQGINANSDRLDISWINDKIAEGFFLKNAARKLCMNKFQDTIIHLSMIRAVKKMLLSSPVSGSGVVLPAAAGEDQNDYVMIFIREAVRITGGAEHPKGSRGLNRECFEQFIHGLDSYRAWRAELKDGNRRELFPFGERTAEVFQASELLGAAVEHFFTVCGIKAVGENIFSDDNSQFFNNEVIKKPENAMDFLPLQKINRNGIIKPEEPVNPKYRQQFSIVMEAIKNRFPSEYKKGIDEDLWGRFRSLFSRYKDWMKLKPEGPYETLTEEFFSEEAVSIIKTIDGILAKTEETACSIEEVRALERLLLIQANLIDFANNFVSFPRLYDISKRAAFEMGSLIMDGRHFNLAVPVLQRDLHQRNARASGMYVLYVLLYDTSAGINREAAVPVTSGGIGNLTMGKRGIFTDILGKEMDAEVIAIIDNPVSLREAVFAPFRRLGKLISSKVDAITMEAEKKLDESTAKTIDQIKNKDIERTGPEKQGNAGAAGMVAAGGVAIAAVSSAVAFITKTLSQIAWWQILIGLGSAAAAVIFPASISAFIKLRNRDLSSIIEASGWAVNGRMRLTYRQSRFFTYAPGKVVKIKKKKSSIKIAGTSQYHSSRSGHPAGEMVMSLKDR